MSHTKTGKLTINSKIQSHDPSCTDCLIGLLLGTLFLVGRRRTQAASKFVCANSTLAGSTNSTLSLGNQLKASTIADTTAMVAQHPHLRLEPRKRVPFTMMLSPMYACRYHLATTTMMRQRHTANYDAVVQGELVKQVHLLVAIDLDAPTTMTEDSLGQQTGT
jgi:hypothetical protein